MMDEPMKEGMFSDITINVREIRTSTHVTAQLLWVIIALLAFIAYKIH